MLKLFFTLLPFLLQAQITNFDIKPTSIKTSTFMNIKILDSKELSFDNINDIEVTELSALAIKENNLYALSDRGYLYYFDISIQNNKINKLELDKAFNLKNKKGIRLKKNMRDSEGMVLIDEGILISFEKKPRVELYSLTGVKIKNIDIHIKLKHIEKYKSKNKALEAIAYNKKHGVLTAPELPLDHKNEKYHRLYTNDKIYKFKACGSITALEFIDDDTVMVLEREFNYISRQRVITLSKVYLDKCKKSVCKSRLLAKLDSKDGWKIDNFEGLTKIGKSQYLMISDDNDSLLQKTLLVLFEI